MPGTPARLAALVVACSLAAGGALVACGLQTDGLGSTGTASGPSTGGSGGSSTSPGSGGNGGAGDAGSEDASPEAAPVDARPPAYVSCLDWLTAEPGATSGVYDLIDTLGNIYPAYCDMVGDGSDGGDGGVAGGWTLAMKIDGHDTGALDYDDALWTNEVALNAGQPDLDRNEAKLPSFWSVPMTELRVGMVEDTTTRWLVVPLAVAGGAVSLFYVIQNGAPQTTLGRGAWEGLLANGSLQTQCAREGINADGLVRIGIVADDDGDCSSPDSFLGFGAVNASKGPFTAPSPPSGNIAEWSPDHGDQTVTTFGYVMVR